MVDAPVSGGIAAAEAGTLTFMVGGTDEAFERARPFLEQMGKAVIHAGDAGAGQAAKICNNMLLGATMVATCEAFVLAQKLGLDLQTFFDISSKASGQSWSMTSYCPVPGVGPETPADRDYEGGFAAALMLKDLRLAMEAAQSVDAYTPMGGEAEELYQRFADRGGGGKDFSGIIKMIDDSWKAPGGVGANMRTPCAPPPSRLLAVAATADNGRTATARPSPSPRNRRLRRWHILYRAESARQHARAPRRHGKDRQDLQGRSTASSTRLARPGEGALFGRTIADCRRKASSWFPPGTGPELGKTGAKPEIWQNRPISSPRMQRLPGRGPRVRRRRRAGDMTVIGAAPASSARPARRATTNTARRCTMSDALKAAGVGLADAALPLAARRFDPFSWWSVKNHHTDWHIWSGVAILTLLLFRFCGACSEARLRASPVSCGTRGRSPQSSSGRWRGMATPRWAH